MQHLLLVDETFDLNSTQEYYLSIQVSLDGFSFCMRDSLQNKYIYLFHKELPGNPQFLRKKLDEVYSQFPILEKEFKSTRIFYSSPGKTNLIPTDFFSENEAENNYVLARELDEKEELLHLPIKKYNFMSQVAIPGKLKKWIQEKHPGSIVQNDLVDFISNFEHKNESLPVLTVHIYKDLLTVCVFDGTLRFFNTFFYSNDNDLLYYILNVSKTLQQEDLYVLLNGRVNKRSVIYHRLRQYFKNVSLLERSKDVHYSYLFDQLPDARFVNLLNSQA